jgi:hypothetical protein
MEQPLLPALLLLLLGFKIFAAFLELRDQPVSLSCSVFRGKSSSFLFLFFGPFLIFCPPDSLGRQGSLSREVERKEGENGQRGERGEIRDRGERGVVAPLGRRSPGHV